MFGYDFNAVITGKSGSFGTKPTGVTNIAYTSRFGFSFAAASTAQACLRMQVKYEILIMDILQRKKTKKIQIQNIPKRMKKSVNKMALKHNSKFKYLAVSET